MKKIIVALVILVSIMHSQIVSYAAENDYDVITFDTNFTDNTSDYNLNDYISESKVYEVCHGLPYHEMRSHAWGTVYVNGNIYIKRGACWQCKYCNKIMVTEGDIVYGQMQPIGKWAIINSNESLGSVQSYFYNPALVGSTKSNSMSGYKFLLN